MINIYFLTMTSKINTEQECPWGTFVVSYYKMAPVGALVYRIFVLGIYESCPPPNSKQNFELLIITGIPIFLAFLSTGRIFSDASWRL